MSHAHLLYLAQSALVSTQEGVGQIMGVSRRTMSRWVASGLDEFLPAHAEPLVRAVYPKDAALAARIAAAAGLTLEGLGLVVAPPAVDPAALRGRIDSVVCAGADALDGSPRAVRPVLYAAFRRAREEGLTLEQVEEALAPAGGGPKRRAPKG